MRTKLSLACASAAGAVLLSLPLLAALPNPYGWTLISELHNACHVGLFFLIQLLLMYLVRRLNTPARHWPALAQLLSCAGVSLMLGGAIELIQVFIHRTPSIGDMFRNTLGISCAAAGFTAWEYRRRPLPALFWLIVALVPLAAAFKPIWPWLKSWHYNRLLFPVLLDTTHTGLRLNVQRTRGADVSYTAPPTHWSSAPATVLKLQLPGDGVLPGMHINFTTPDWTAYEDFRFNAFLPGDHPLRFGLNFYSLKGEKTELAVAVVTLQPGANSLSVPLASLTPFNPSRVRSMTWHALEQPGDTTVFLQNIHLHR